MNRSSKEKIAVIGKHDFREFQTDSEWAGCLDAARPAATRGCCPYSRAEMPVVCRSCISSQNGHLAAVPFPRQHRMLAPVICGKDETPDRPAQQPTLVVNTNRTDIFAAATQSVS